MQEVLRERRTCRNVVEALDFLCGDYDVYMKQRLITLCTRRCTYRNGFGLAALEVSANIIAIERHGESSVFTVTEDIGALEVEESMIDLKTGACSDCDASRFCVHVSAAACAYPECMVRRNL